jgi:hypothetical protein
MGQLGHGGDVDALNADVAIGAEANKRLSAAQLDRLLCGNLNVFAVHNGIHTGRRCLRHGDLSGALFGLHYYNLAPVA